MIPAKGVCCIRAGLQPLLWDFPIFPWLEDVAALLCFLWNRSVIPAASPAQALLFSSPFLTLSGFICADPSSLLFLGLEKFQPVEYPCCVEAFSSPVTSLISLGWKLCSTHRYTWDVEFSMDRGVRAARLFGTLKNKKNQFFFFFNNQFVTHLLLWVM